MATTTITGFHQDAEGDWVEVGRAERVGQEIECPLCATADEPSRLSPDR